MRVILALLSVGLCFLKTQGSDRFETERLRNWHQWRGPEANGTAPFGKPPIQWDNERNIRWRRELPGEGTSTPIIWGNQVFVLTAVETDREAESEPRIHPDALTEPPSRYFQFVVMSFDKETGRERWRHIAAEAVPHEGRHPTHSYAAASPVTDGEHLYVSFGSRGIFCFDLRGELVWRRDLGEMRTRYGWGEATSPVLRNGTLVVNWDHEDRSFIEALDARTGATRWKIPRDEPTSWATPLAVEFNGRTQVIVNGTNRIRSYDLESGSLNWECGGLTVNCIPSPLRFGETVISMSGYRGAVVYAIPLDARGSITARDDTAWSYHRGTPYVPSPLLSEGRIYFTAANSAILTSLNASTGEPVFEQERLGGLGTLYASPVAAAGHGYFVDRNGLTVVIEAGSSPKIVARNKLDAEIDASPAIVGTQLFLRGRRKLFCIQSD